MSAPETFDHAHSNPGAGVPFRIRPVPQYEPRTEPGLPSVRAAVRRRPDRAECVAPVRVVPHRADADPAAVATAAHLLRVTLEVLDRRRAASHLAGVMSPSLAARAPAILAAARRRGRLATLRSMHVQQVSAAGVEVFGRIEQGGRSWAIVARLDAPQGRWVATALRFG